MSMLKAFNYFNIVSTLDTGENSLTNVLTTTTVIQSIN